MRNHCTYNWRKDIILSRVLKQQGCGFVFVSKKKRKLGVWYLVAKGGFPFSLFKLTILLLIGFIGMVFEFFQNYC